MEVGDQHINDSELESRNYDDSRARSQGVKSVGIKIIQDAVKGFRQGISILSLIRHPLPDIRRATLLQTFHTYII